MNGIVSLISFLIYLTLEHRKGGDLPNLLMLAVFKCFHDLFHGDFVYPRHSYVQNGEGAYELHKEKQKLDEYS